VYANEAFLSVVDCPIDQLIGADLLELVDERDGAPLLSLLREATLACTDPRLVDLRWRSAAGDATLLRCSCLPVAHRGVPAFLVIGMRP
jgi:hypothetical protein